MVGSAAPTRSVPRFFPARLAWGTQRRLRVLPGAAVHWGVDSKKRASEPTPVPVALREPSEDADTRIPLFEVVTRTMGRAPEYWGRYLNRRLPVDPRTHEVLSPPDARTLTPDEIEFLHARGCRIAPIYNGASGRSSRLEQLTGGGQGGHDAAAHAQRLCEQLGVPAHVAVYADAENWPGDSAWFRRWYETLRGSGRRCGVYGRPVRVVGNPAAPGREYGIPLDDLRSGHARRAARARIEEQTRWSGVAPRRVAVRDYWGDELADAMTDVLVDGVTRRGVDPFRGPGAEPFLVWSNEPRRVLSADEDANLDESDIPSEFVPAQPPMASGIRTVLWQYLENAVFAGGAHGNVDMNLCDDTGFAAMW